MLNIINIWKEYKSWILFGLVSFFAIHMIIFTNYLPCWDTYGSLQMEYTAMRIVGRWLFGPSSIILHSAYDLEWLAGVLSAIFVTASSILMIDLWGIKRPIHRGIIIFLIAAFPSMMATYVYMFVSAAYMMSFFLAIMGVYISQKGKTKRFVLLAGICIMLSLAVYQAYLLAAVGMFVLFLISELLQNVECKVIKKQLLKLIITCGIGGVLYKAVEIIYKLTGNYQLSNYQGISDVGNITLLSGWNGLKKLICDTMTFYFWKESCAYRIINIILLGLIFISIVRWIFMDHDLSRLKKILIMGLFFFIIPLTYSFYFISPGVEYHRLMEFGNIYIYFVPLILFEYSNIYNVGIKIQKHLRKVCICMLIVLCFYHFRNDNVVYKQLEVYAERTRYETYEIINKIDEISGGVTKEIAIIGCFRLEGAGYSIEPIPDTIGIMKNFHAVPQSFVNFAGFYYARNYYLASQEKIDEIKETEEYKMMDVYPQGNCVKEINGVIVINLQ